MRTKTVILETSRVTLTEINQEDAPLLVDLDSDPEVMKHLTGGRASTADEIQATMARVLALKEAHSSKFGVWLAFDKTNDEFMGWFLFRPDRKNPTDLDNIELGYRLKKKFWGHGYATEVSKAIIEKAFKELNLNSIFAITLKANLGSQAVMKKVGMTWIQDYIEDQFPGEDKAAVRFCLLKSDYKN
jgi:RimJ/RimL family protein N-acetyltransferase